MCIFDFTSSVGDQLVMVEGGFRYGCGVYVAFATDEDSFKWQNLHSLMLLSPLCLYIANSIRAIERI